MAMFLRAASLMLASLCNGCSRLHAGWELDAEFQVERNLGEQPYDGDGPYDVVTCMFAMHYFFESESRLRMFLYNVSNNLAPGEHIGLAYDDVCIIVALIDVLICLGSALKHAHARTHI